MTVEHKEKLSYCEYCEVWYSEEGFNDCDKHCIYCGRFLPKLEELDVSNYLCESCGENRLLEGTVKIQGGFFCIACADNIQEGST